MKGKEVKKFTYDENRSALDNFKLWLYENGNERYWNEEKPLQYKEAVNIFTSFPFISSPCKRLRLTQRLYTIGG